VKERRFSGGGPPTSCKTIDKNANFSIFSLFVIDVMDAIKRSYTFTERIISAKGTQGK